MLSSRCAVHASRPSVDNCPVCGRARCRADAQAYAVAGCLACRQVGSVRRQAGPVELIVRAGLAGVAVALFDAWVETQYVRVHLMSVAAPLVGGLAAAWACGAAAGRGGRQVRAAVIATAAGSAVLGAALAFRVSADGGLSPVHPLGRVGPPYLAALIGVVAWRVLFAVPRQPDGEAEDSGTAS